MTSVSSGRWGPCGSVEPTGSSATARRAGSFSIASIRVQLSADRSWSREVDIEDPLDSIPQLGAQHLAPIAARQPFDELDPSRVLVGRQTPLDEGLQVERQLPARP